MYTVGLLAKITSWWQNVGSLGWNFINIVNFC